MTLHWRKQLFIEEYVAHPELNAAEVAVRCGFEPKYAKNRAYEMLQNPEVKAAIEHRQKELLAKLQLTAEDVIKDILAARQRCVDAGDGAWQTQGRLKCDELLGKYLGMWQERVDLEVDFGERLAERLQKAREQAGRVVEGQEILPPKPVPALPVSPAAKQESLVSEAAWQPKYEDWVEKYENE